MMRNATSRLFIEQIEGVILVPPAMLAQMIAELMDVGDFSGPFVFGRWLRGELDGRMAEVKQNLSAPAQSFQFAIEWGPINRE